jgi:hypothetical protein
VGAEVHRKSHEVRDGVIDLGRILNDVGFTPTNRHRRARISGLKSAMKRHAAQTHCQRKKPPEQLAAQQEQMDQNIAALQSVEEEIRKKVSSPPTPL